MRLLRTSKRLAVIVWKDGSLSWLWAIASATPGLIQSARKYFPDETQMLLALVSAVQWWWGLPILALWVMYSLSRRILKYETPSLEVSAFRDIRTENSWWVEVTNSGVKELKNCAVDFVIETVSGERLFPTSFGLHRGKDVSNPFPLRGGQAKQGVLATLEGQEIVVFGNGIGGKDQPVRLKDNEYIIKLSAYSEQEETNCKKTLTLNREEGRLYVS